MIKRVKVKNYQSLYDIEVELGNFSVIYGESNVGKSAFYRAIKGLVIAERGDDFISKRNDTLIPKEENKVEVSLFLKDSKNPVKWIKEKGKSSKFSYGEDVWRHCNNPPEKIKKVLKLSSIDVFGDTFYPNFNGQFDPLFLIFESSGKRAKVLGWLISNILLDGIRYANKERNQRSADVRSLKEFLDRLKERKEVDWDSILNELSQLDKNEKQLRRAEDVILLLKNIRSEIEQNNEMMSTEFKDIEDAKWKKLERLLSILDHLLNLQEGEEQKKKIENKIKEKSEQLENMGAELKELKKKLTFPCPKCGYKISLLEMEK